MLLYHIACDGQIITSEPMTLDAIIKCFGPVQKLEKQGFRLIKVGAR